MEKKLTEQLMPLFEKSEADLDLVMNRTKKRLSLERLFNHQIYILEDRGWPNQVLDFFWIQKNSVIDRAMKINFKKGHILFLPITPWIYQDIYSQIQAVRCQGQSGSNYRNPAKINNIEEIPKQPYYIYDVEIGLITLGKSPEQAEKYIREQERYPLVTEEIISLAVLNNVLSQYNIDACGSRFKNEVLCLSMTLNKPELRSSDMDCGNKSWGAPSCGARV